MSQPGYKHPHERIWASCENKEDYTVIYGKDEDSGIWGLRHSVDLAMMILLELGTP